MSSSLSDSSQISLPRSRGKRKPRTKEIPLNENREGNVKLFWKLASGKSDVLLRRASMVTQRIEVGKKITIVCGETRILVRRVVRVEEYDKKSHGESADHIRDRMLTGEKENKKHLKSQAISLRSSSGRVNFLTNSPLVVIEFEKLADVEEEQEEEA